MLTRVCPPCAVIRAGTHASARLEVPDELAEAEGLGEKTPKMAPKSWLSSSVVETASIGLRSDTAEPESEEAEAARERCSIATRAAAAWL